MKARFAATLRTVGRGARAALIWFVAVLLSLVVSVYLHLQLAHSRGTTRRLVEELVSGIMRGSLEIGRLDSISLDGVRATECLVRDEEGRVVLRVGRVNAGLDLSRLFSGRLVISPAIAEDVEAAMYVVGEDGMQVSFVEAFQPASPSQRSHADTPTFLVDVEDLHVIHGRAFGDVPKFSGLRVDDLEAYGSLHFGDGVQVVIREGHGMLTAPYRGAVRLYEIGLRFDTNPWRGLEATVRSQFEDSRARATIRFRTPEDVVAIDMRRYHLEADYEQRADDARVLDIQVQAEPVSLANLSELGIQGTQYLSGTASGNARLLGIPGDLRLTGQLETEGGSVAVDGLMGADPWTFHARTDGLDLHDLVPIAPVTRVRGEAQAIVSLDHENAPVELSANVDSFDVLGYRIPRVHAAARYHNESIDFSEIDAQEDHGAVRGSGNYGPDGALSLHLHLRGLALAQEENVQDVVPGLRGTAHGEIHVERADSDAPLHVAFDGGAKRFAYQGVRAENLSAHFTMTSRGARAPLLALQVSGANVGAYGQRLAHAEATLSGQDGSYALTLNGAGGRPIETLRYTTTLVLGEHDFTLAEGHVVLQSPIGLIEGQAGSLTVMRGEALNWNLRGVDLHVSEGALHVPSLRFGHGDVDGDIRVDNISLESLGPLLPERLRQLRGILRANMRVFGQSAVPAIELTGHIERASFDAVRGATLDYRFLYQEDALEVDITGSLGNRGQLVIVGPMVVPRAFFTGDGDPLDVRTDVRFEQLHLYGDQINLAFVTPLFGSSVSALGLGGKVSFDAFLEGPFGDVEMPSFAVILDRFGLPGWTPLRIKTRGHWQSHELVLEPVWVADSEGELLLAETRFHFDVSHFPATSQDFAREAVLHPLQFALRLEPRLGRSYPEPLRRYIAGPFSFGGMVYLRGDGRSLTGNVEATVAAAEPVTEAACATEQRPKLQIRGQLANGYLTLDGALFAERDRVGSLRVSSLIPSVNELAALDFRSMQPDVDVQLVNVPTERLPWTCDRLRGNVELLGQMRLFAANANVRARAQWHDLQLLSAARATMPVSGYATLQPSPHTPNHLLVCGAMGAGVNVDTTSEACARAARPDSGESLVRGFIRAEFQDGELLPREDPSADLFDLSAVLADASLEPFLTFLPQLSEGDARARGQVSARGTLDHTIFSGSVEIDHGVLGIAALGQQLTGVRGHAHFEGNRLLVTEEEPLRADDDGGEFTAYGEVGFRGLFPDYAQLSVALERFPFRREGATSAWLTGFGDVRLSLGEEETDVEIVVRELSMQLPETQSRAVQDIVDPAEVLVIGADLWRTLDSLHDSLPYNIHLDAQTPFTVRNNDFNVRVSSLLDVTYQSPNLYLNGLASIEGGYYDLFTKRFELQRGSIAFNGEAGINPRIDLLLTHTIVGTSTTVSISISGTLADYRIDFASNVTNDRGEILALLVGGRRTSNQDTAQLSQQVSNQAGNFVLGLTVGVAMLGVRQQLGEIGRYVPTFGYNPDTNEVSASVSPEWLIPDVLRDFVQGIYLEGFVSTNQNGNAGRVTSGGSGGRAGLVRLELQLPNSFLASASYLPPIGFGFDLSLQVF